MPMRQVSRLMKDRPLPVVHPTAPRAPYVMRVRKGKPYTVLHPVRPSLAIELAYRKRLYAMIDAMAASVQHWVTSAYESNKPHSVVMAQDAWLPANMLKDALQRLANLWLHNFDETANELATYFATSVEQRNTKMLQSSLAKGGFAVQFHMTPAQLDIIEATINQNVALIKSIPQQYLTQVEGMVMRSVQTGRDVGGLAKDLEKQLGVTRRRAALIARDQSNKATSALNTARYKELGIKTAIWMHSHSGRYPRPTHVAMNNKPYDVSKGMWDKDVGEWVFPGSLVNCKCVARPVIHQGHMT